jgi:hypothetical protein
MEEEEKKEYKMLGLYEKQSLIPSLIMFITHGFTDAYSVCTKFSMEEYLKMDSEQISDFYDWYIHYPTLFLAFFLLGRYCDYIFRNNDKKRLFSFLSCMVVGSILLLIFRISFTTFFYWDQI